MRAPVPGGQPGGDGQDIDLPELATRILRYWKGIAGAVVLSVALAGVVLLYMAPVYRADAMLQVEQGAGSDLMGRLSQVLPEGGGAPRAAPEIELLKSRMVLGKTVNDLKLRVVVKRRYRPLVGYPLARLSGRPAERIEVSRLSVPDGLLEPGRPMILTVLAQGKWRLDAGGVRVEGETGKPAECHGIMADVKVVDAPPGTEFAITLTSEREAVDALLKRVSVRERGRDSGILEITLTGDDPAQAVRILQRITENFFRQNVARRAERDSRSLAFLGELLPRVRAALDEAESRLSLYRSERDSVDLTLEARAVLEQIVNAERQLNELTFREAELSRLYRRDHPAYQVLAAKRHTLEQERERLGRQVSSMPVTQQEVLRLSRDVDSGREVYLRLLNREQELNISRASVTGNVRIIDPASAQPRATGPQSVLILVLGGVLGLMASVGLVVLRMALHRGIDTPEQLEEAGISVCATVPQSDWLIKAARRGRTGGERHFLPVANPGDIAVEAIRGLRTIVHFMAERAGRSTLMVTGATPGCGKTFVSSALAAVMAQGGLRVLFIDADMRRGYAHELFQLPAGPGLSEVLCGRAELGEAVRHYGPGGFDVLTRGAVPVNPAELLMDGRFGAVMRSAEAGYDMVIADTAPVLEVTDAAVVGQHAGISLVVAQAELNTVKEIIKTNCKLELVDVTTCYTVLNMDWRGRDL